MSNSPADRRRAQVLERIADAALELVLEGGLEGLTMARLAKRVDYTAPALYRYVPSKGALIAELNRMVLEAHRSRLHAAWAPGDLPPDEALRRAARTLVAHAREVPGAFGLVALTIADPRPLVTDAAPAHAPVLMALVADLAGVLARGVREGVFREGDAARRAVRWLFGLMGTLQLGKLARFDPRLDAGAITLDLADDMIQAWMADSGGA